MKLKEIYTDSISCSSNLDCVINSECKNNFCQCFDKFIYSADKTKCLKVVGSYGDACEESQQCSEFLHAGGICSDGICLCKLGYFYLHGKCWKSLSLKEKCSNNYTSNCYVNFDIDAAKCQDNICQCSENYYQREYRSCRRRAKNVDDVCLIDLDCAFDQNKNYTCKNTKCSVKLDNKMGNLTDKKLSTNIQNSKNKIEENFNLISDNTRGDVSCPRAHFYSENHKKCVAEIGEFCNMSDEILIVDSNCLNNHWICKNGFVPSLNNRLCRKVTKVFNKSCKFAEQCYIFGPDAICENKKCICNEKSHFIEDELFCWVNKLPGDVCNDDKDCFNVKSNIKYHCIDNICTCPTGFHVNSEKFCVPDAQNVGDGCTEHADCQSIDNTNCTDNICSCVENYYEKFEKCIPGLYTKCNEIINCTVKNSHCKDGLCICNDNYISNSPDLCSPIVEYGKLCKYHSQCQAVDPNTWCESSSIDDIQRNCRCQLNYHRNYGRCFKIKALNENCNNVGECYVESSHDSVVCVNGKCKCHSTAHQINKTYCKNQSTTIRLSMWILLTIISKLLL